MTTPLGSTTSSESLYSSLGLSSSQSSKQQTLGQQDFLKLMTVQIQNQDPLKPMENTEFFSQIAQFSTVSGIEKLQAAALIGRDVLTPSKVGVLYDTGLEGAIDVPSSGAVKLEVRDADGALVRTLNLGTQPAGQISFNWDGIGANGTALPPGLYQIAATVQGAGTAAIAASTYALDRVASVSTGASGLSVQMLNLGEVAFGDVTRIQ